MVDFKRPGGPARPLNARLSELATILRWQNGGASEPRNAAHPAASPWWDVPAKFEAARRIEAEERMRPGHNDRGDGVRHASASRRLADEAGPVFSVAAGLGHEADNLLSGGPLSESIMDMINNSEGIAASIQRRPIDPQRLQTAPIPLRAAAMKAEQQYEDTTPGRAMYPSRPYGQGIPSRGYRDAPRAVPEERYRAY